MGVMDYDVSLIDKVICQMQTDIEDGDTTAIEELLKQLPKEVLEAYLPEGSNQ